MSEKKDNRIASQVMRIPKDLYVRIQEIKGKQTYAETLGAVLDFYHEALSQEPLYAVGKHLYKDIAEARGAAIMEAIRAKEVPIAPKVVMLIGQDELLNLKGNTDATTIQS